MSISRRSVKQRRNTYLRNIYRDLKNNSIGYDHVAGIIPVSNLLFDYEFPWHGCMMPIGDGKYLIDRSITECLAAGAKNIWIVADEDIQPFIRKHVGEKTKNGVKIFYISFKPEDYISKRAGSLNWTIISGMFEARKLTRPVGEALGPAYFYVSFPNVVHNYPTKIVLGKESNFIFETKDGKSIYDNQLLGCGFDVQSMGRFWNYVFGEAQKPIEEQTLEDMLKVRKKEFAIFEKVRYYYDVSTWEGYTAFIGSGDDLKDVMSNENWENITHEEDWTEPPKRNKNKYVKKWKVKDDSK